MPPNMNWLQDTLLHGGKNPKALVHCCWRRGEEATPGICKSTGKHVSGQGHEKMVAAAARENACFAEVGGQGQRRLLCTVFAFTLKSKNSEMNL